MSNNSQILVSGAGIVGLSMALSLLKQGLPVKMLAPNIKAKANLGEQYHPRIYAISLASQQFLQKLGVWRVLPTERLVAVEHMQIQGDASGLMTLSANTSTSDQLAWIVESGELEYALQQAVNFHGLEWIDDKAKQLQYKRSPDNKLAIDVTTEKGQVLSANLLISAEGMNSVIRQQAGIWHKVKSYHAKGLVAQFTVEKPHQNTAYQWFTNEGVLAFLPLPDTKDGHQISMVWSTDSTTANELLNLTVDNLADVLRKRVGHLSQDTLGQLILRSPMYGFDLSLEKSGLVSHGVALIGDAAHRVHPLAGQGLNLGLGDVESLSRILKEKEPYREFGDSRVLQRYQRERSEPLAHMRWITDGLQQLFTRQELPLQFIRNVGLDAIDNLPFIKEFLVRKASGL
ncbi:ubiquinone biosynthesis hydroxylase UbiH [Pelistega indica]|uniref:Ubiquinone biosynthesis hydroxylase UbiH n=1 Tax=Pelistega indica TaxID=1414851 RepID=V8G044_9BURK|nr:FAD-dependent monooxygenase [Pelistega indica]ETD69889.1 ubiquinone biosynthesis hydroxylase UbiH [Pelistega indica]